MEEKLVIRSVVERAARRLAAAGVDSPRQDAWLLLAHLRGADRASLLADSHDGLDPREVRQLECLVERRAAREPLAQIVGAKEFWSLTFQISADVLCPRPDSECLVEAALEQIDRKRPPHRWAGRILDLGTGSGCLLLALLSELPMAYGIGIDISTSALAMARSNGQRLGLDARVDWMCGHWGAALDGCFDLIISNPPYIAEGETLAPEVRQYEPANALFAGSDGLDAYRSLRYDLGRLLAPGGQACIELGAGQAASVEALMRESGLQTLASRQDLAGIDRCLILQRC